MIFAIILVLTLLLFHQSVIIKDNSHVTDINGQNGTKIVETINIILFHLVFTTSTDWNIKLVGGSIVKGAWNWRHQSTLESIFYHHPMSTVLIHSNTLHDSQFEDLRNAGYDVQVRPYNLSLLLLASPAAGLAPRLAQKQDKGPHWYSHQSDILRFLMVYNHGGVYMDTDMILLKNLDTLQDNVVGWATSTNIGSAFLKFKKGNLFLQRALQKLESKYTGNNWGEIGPTLLTEVFKSSSELQQKGVVTALPTSAFFPFVWEKVGGLCFHEQDESKVAEMKHQLKDSFIIHLNSKLTGGEDTAMPGTLCHYLFTHFCLICSKQ